MLPRMRTAIIAGNWKMYKTAAAAVSLIKDLEGKLEGAGDVEVVVCPPFTALSSVASALRSGGASIKLGAQNLHWETEGAFTGEISPLMLTELGVRYVIIGHSERRQHFGETDETVNLKVAAAFAHGLLPIACVGESLEQREAGSTSQVVERQVLSGLGGLTPEAANSLVVAYEPIWAIGTGRNATPEDANDVIRHIRAVIGSMYGPEAARQVRLLYGGSVKPDNVDAFMEEPDIDGALVGGASLDAAGFARIVKFQSPVRPA